MNNIPYKIPCKICNKLIRNTETQIAWHISDHIHNNEKEE